jgi:hypothetical protein
VPWRGKMTNNPATHCGCRRVPGRRNPLYLNRNHRPSHQSSCSCPFYSNKGRKSRRPHPSTRIAGSILLQMDNSCLPSCFIISLGILELKIRLHPYGSCKIIAPTHLYEHETTSRTKLLPGRPKGPHTCLLSELCPIYEWALVKSVYTGQFQGNNSRGKQVESCVPNGSRKT